MAMRNYTERVPESLSLCPVTNVCLCERPIFDDVLTCSQGFVELGADQIVGHFDVRDSNSVCGL